MFITRGQIFTIDQFRDSHFFIRRNMLLSCHLLSFRKSTWNLRAWNLRGTTINDSPLDVPPNTLNLPISEQINELVKYINLATPATSIILFGSHASGTPTKDSDIDICVIMPKQEKRKLQILREIRKAIAPIYLCQLIFLCIKKGSLQKEQYYRQR